MHKRPACCGPGVFQSDSQSANSILDPSRLGFAPCHHAVQNRRTDPGAAKLYAEGQDVHSSHRSSTRSRSRQEAMSADDEGTTLSKLEAELRSFKEWAKDMFHEREKLSLERASKIEARIDAMKEQTKIAFASSEKAVDKSEQAQKEYNARSNEFRAALDDAQRNTVSIVRFDDFRKDYDSYKVGQATEIRSLRESRSMLDGRHAGSVATWGTVVTICGVVFGGLGALIGRLLK